MKVALLLYGYLRQYKLCYNNIIEQLNINKEDLDIFIYTSKKNHLKLLNYRPVKWENIEDNSEENLKKFFGNNLKAVKFKEDDDLYREITIEKFNKLKKIYIDFMEENEDYLKKISNHNYKRIRDYINLKNYNLNDHFKTKTWIFRQTDQFINLHLCSKLFQDYVKINNENYDLVIQMRPDVIFTHKINLNNFIQQIKNNEFLAIPCIDYFYVSNIEINKKLNQLYKEYGKINKEELIHKTYFSPEAQSSKFIKNNFNLIKFKLRTNYLRNFKNINLKEEIYSKFKLLTENIYKKKLINIQQPILHK
jgi:hypothetical protein